MAHCADQGQYHQQKDKALAFNLTKADRDRFLDQTPESWDMPGIKSGDLKTESFLMAEWWLNIKQISIKHSTVKDVYKMIIRCPSCLVGAYNAVE